MKIAFMASECAPYLKTGGLGDVAQALPEALARYGEAARAVAEARLEAVLGEVSGAGRVSVLYSDEGVAVVCEGAESARVRLDIVNAVSAYTGFGSDRIKVLSMERSD